MWSRSTKQRRSAMRRRALVAIAPFRDADIGSVRLLPSPPGEMRFRWTETPTRLRTAEEQQALYEQRPFVPNPRTSMHAAHYLNAPLVALTPPKEQ